MDLDDLESRLRGIPLRKPSEGLDRRVLSLGSGMTPAPSGRLGVPVPLWAAAAAALLLGAGGFFAGFAARGSDAPWRPARDSAPHHGITVEVMLGAGTPSNPFDFTRASEQFPPGAMETRIR